MLARPAISHVAPISLDTSSGMGRVAFHWQASFVRRGWDFHHFGANEVIAPMFKPLWALSAGRAWRASGCTSSSLVLAHEPAAESFRVAGARVALFSHGLEARCRDLVPPDAAEPGSSLKKLLMRPLWAWRERQAELGLRRCPLLLLINQEDKDYAIRRYQRRSEDIFVFRNGVNPSDVDETHEPSGGLKVLVYGTWLERKGKSVLVKAARKLADAGIQSRWLLCGTGFTRDEVLRDWPEDLHSFVEVRPRVRGEDDDSIYSEAHVFVLPSFFEGQPLTLLQAMESGRCVISTRCCGQKDIIRHGVNGLLAEPGDAEGLSLLISSALNNPNLRRTLGAQAKADMKNRQWMMVSDEVTDRLVQFSRDQVIHE